MAPSPVGPKPVRRTARADVTSLRALNRATLARQMLLERVAGPALDAVERLVALQAQVARPPFVGLHARVSGFKREALARAIEKRQVVRATFLRGTLHLLAAKDYRALRSTLQPALTHGAASILRARGRGVDLDRLLTTARAFFGERPHTFEELRTFLERRDAKADVRAHAYLVRLHLPLVQVPASGAWGYPTTSEFTLADAWVKRPLDEKADPAALVLRYLAAFGPGGITDFQTWSGFPPPAARAAFDAARDRLDVLHVERGRELFDVPGAPRPPADTPAPARLLPEFDNLVLSHADRRRFVPETHRAAVYLPGLRVAATFLVDGFVAGTWSVARNGKRATITLEPFGALSRGARADLEAEAEPLARFLEPEATRAEVAFGGAVATKKRPPA